MSGSGLGAEGREADLDPDGHAKEVCVLILEKAMTYWVLGSKKYRRRNPSRQW